jgi:hypothetical protein
MLPVPTVCGFYFYQTIHLKAIQARAQMEYSGILGFRGGHHKAVRKVSE